MDTDFIYRPRFRNDADPGDARSRRKTSRALLDADDRPTGLSSHPLVFVMEYIEEATVSTSIRDAEQLTIGESPWPSVRDAASFGR
jgi:hypothetical protein